jgi:hypothetical protein
MPIVEISFLLEACSYGQNPSSRCTVLVVAFVALSDKGIALPNVVGKKISQNGLQAIIRSPWSSVDYEVSHMISFSE